MNGGFAGIKNDDGNSAKRSTDLAGIDGAGCPFGAVHHLRVSGDGRTSLAGTRPGAMAGGDGAR